jgi:hypothetical protein
LARMRYELGQVQALTHLTGHLRPAVLLPASTARQRKLTLDASYNALPSRTSSSRCAHLARRLVRFEKPNLASLVYGLPARTAARMTTLPPRNLGRDALAHVRCICRVNARGDE